MRIGNRLFPYPMLNNAKLYSQYKDSSFELIYEEERINDDYVLKNIRCKLNNPSLINLIKEGKAQIYCVVECPEAMYRKNFILSLENSTIKIPLRELNNKVSVSAFLVATEEINDYYSDDFLDDYENYHFDIEKYDVLALDEGFVNNISFNSEEDSKKTSIFLVIKDKNIKDELMKIEYDNSKIIILLPEEQWNEYEKTKRIKKLESLYFSLMAIPSLAYALSLLQAKAESGVDMLRLDYKWFNSFATQYNKIHGAELTDEEFSKLNTNVEVQKLMNAPVTKAIDDIFDLTMGNFGDEYED